MDCFGLGTNYSVVRRLVKPTKRTLVIREMLDGESNLLAAEMLEDYVLAESCAHGPSGPPGRGAALPTPPAEGGQSVMGNGTCVLSREPIVVTKHRRVKKNYRVSFIQEVVSECKVKFYGATDTVANRKAIHRFGTRFCENHGMRTQHIRSIMPTVVELVLTPDKWELEARNIASTRFVQTRRGLKLSLWHRFLNWAEGVDVGTPSLEC